MNHLEKLFKEDILSNKYKTSGFKNIREGLIYNLEEERFILDMFYLVEDIMSLIDSYELKIFTININKVEKTNTNDMHLVSEIVFPKDVNKIEANINLDKRLIKDYFKNAVVDKFNGFQLENFMKHNFQCSITKEANTKLIDIKNKLIKDLLGDKYFKMYEVLKEEQKLIPKEINKKNKV